MGTVLRSVFTAVVLACLVQTCTIGIIAPGLPRSVAAPATVSQTRHLVQPAAPQLRLNNADGSVWIYTHAKNTVEAQVNLRLYTREAGMDAEALAYAEELITISELDGALEIATEPHERPDEFELFADYKIWVPEGTDLQLRSANGNVSVAEGCGKVEIRGRNTDVSVTGPEGLVYARTTNGRVRVLDAESGADIETVNGNVYAHVMRGDLAATTTNGLIVARLLNADVDTCDLTTRNGGITVVMDDACSAKVEARTARGAVIAEGLPIDASDGVNRRRHLRGVLGEGRTDMKMDTLNGNIWIMRNGS